MTRNATAEGTDAAVATAATAAVADSPGQTIASPIDTASLSTEIKACSDFYRFVNARWSAATEIPADRSSWGAFDELDKRNKAIVRLLEDHQLRYMRCLRKDCRDYHWCCTCNDWQGSRILNDATNVHSQLRW